MLNKQKFIYVLMRRELETDGEYTSIIANPYFASFDQQKVIEKADQNNRDSPNIDFYITYCSIDDTIKEND